jgi:hypothetical protein
MDTVLFDGGGDYFDSVSAQWSATRQTRPVSPAAIIPLQLLV